MLLRFKLGDHDRERYGLPEWVEIDLDNPTLGDTRLLKLNVLVPGRDGELVGMVWKDLRNSLLAQDDFAAGAAMWVALRKAGVTLPWNEFDPVLRDAHVESGEGDDPNSSAPTGAAQTSTPSRPRSRASTASTRGTSKSSRSGSSTRTSKS